MDYKAFVANRARAYYPEREGEQKEILKEADKWSDFFESLVLQRFEQPSGPIIEYEELVTTLRGYDRWSREPLAQFMTTLQHNTERSAQLRNYLNFHTMSNAFLDQWYRLAIGVQWDRKSANTCNSETQDRLALASLLMKREKDKLTGNLTTASIDGILTEYDTGIIILETAKKHPELLVVPAPGRFEHGTPSKNADFLVIDTEQAQVTGMQSKTSIDTESYNRYDPGYVFMVDARTDLANYISKREPGTSKQRPVSMPGLIAAHHIMKWPKTSNLATKPWLKRTLYDERSLASIKFYARSLTLQTKDTSTEAVHRVGQRALHKLYEQPASTQTIALHASPTELLQPA